MAQVNTTTLGEGRAEAGRGLVAGASAAAKRPAGGWKPQELTESFSLDEAVDKAMNKAERQMNWTLSAEGVVVRRSQLEGQRGLETMVNVTEKETEKVLRTYDAATFLGLYAARDKAHGVVVDGQV